MRVTRRALKAEADRKAKLSPEELAREEAIEAAKPQPAGDGKTYAVHKARKHLTCHRCKGPIRSGSWMGAVESWKTIHRTYGSDRPSKWSKQVPWKYFYCLTGDCWRVPLKWQRCMRGPVDIKNFGDVTDEAVRRAIRDRLPEVPGMSDLVFEEALSEELSSLGCLASAGSDVLRLIAGFTGWFSSFLRKFDGSDELQFPSGTGTAGKRKREDNLKDSSPSPKKAKTACVEDELDFSGCSLSGLKRMCKVRGLLQKGHKSDVIARLKEAARTEPEREEEYKKMLYSKVSTGRITGLSAYDVRIRIGYTP